MRKCAKNSAKIAVISNVTHFEPLPLHWEQLAVVRFPYLLKKTSDADVCSHERSVQWTDARSQHHFLLASEVYTRAGLCITEAKEWEISSGLCRDNGECDPYDACGYWFLIAITDSTRQYFANHREKDYALSFLSCNFHKGVRLRFYAKRSYRSSICVTRLIFFTGHVTNSGLHAAFFTFSIRNVPDSWRDVSHYLKLNPCILENVDTKRNQNFLQKLLKMLQI